METSCKGSLGGTRKLGESVVLSLHERARTLRHRDGTKQTTVSAWLRIGMGVGTYALEMGSVW